MTIIWTVESFAPFWVSNDLRAYFFNIKYIYISFSLSYRKNNDTKKLYWNNFFFIPNIFYWLNFNLSNSHVNFRFVLFPLARLWFRPKHFLMSHKLCAMMDNTYLFHFKKLLEAYPVPWSRDGQRTGRDRKSANFASPALISRQLNWIDYLIINHRYFCT